MNVEDSESGADVTVTGEPGRVAEIRKRAADAAGLYGAGAHRGLGHHGEHMGAQRHGLRLTELPPVEATVEDIEGGARIRLVAKLAPQADTLRERVRARVDVINGGPCDLD